MSTPTADKPRRARPQIWIGLALGVAALYLVLRSIDFAQLRLIFREVRWPFIGLTLLACLLSPVLKAARWRWLFHPQRPKLRLLPLASMIVIGQAVNFMIPGRWGELVRMYLTGEEAGISKSYTLGTIAAEKVLDLVVLAVLVVGLIPFVALPAGLAGRVEIIALTAVAVVLGLAAPRAALAIWSWTLAFWLTAALANLLLLLAFGLPASPLIALVVLAVLQGGVAVPSTPGKIGVFQLLCIAALAVFGVPDVVGLAYGVMLYVLVVGGVSVWAALALWRRSWSLSRLTEASAAWR